MGIVEYRRGLWALLLAGLPGVLGCGAGESGRDPVADSAAAQSPAPLTEPAARLPAAALRDVGSEGEESQSLPVTASFGPVPSESGGRDRLGDELPQSASQPPRWEDAQIAAAGIRKVAGRHLTLYTDLPPSPAVDELPGVFDLAIPQWCEYFDVPAARAESWRLHGYLMLDKERFYRIGMLPRDLPPFLHGFQRDHELWLYEQPSAYYRRHLLLHEGTHGFMNWALGGAGPPWYMEGMAELLATHQWNEGQLQMRYLPHDKQDVSHWGRIKKIQDEMKEDRARTLEQIMQYDATAHLEVAPYAWCWAAAAFFDGHPVYRQPFLDLRGSVQDRSSQFSRQFYEQLRAQWPHLARQWQLFIINLVYGYDIQREAIEQKPARQLPAEGASVTVAADRGWQSTGFRLEQGRIYRIEASGRYQIAGPPEIWWCEPNGVTIRYYNGLPLGMLLGALIDEDQPPEGTTPLAVPDPIGLGGDSDVRHSGTLYLRVNDSPAELADNSGHVNVRIIALTQGEQGPVPN